MSLPTTLNEQPSHCIQPFPKRFTTKDCKRDQYKINQEVRLPNGAPAYTTGWGDAEQCMVETRDWKYGRVEVYRMIELTQVADQFNLLNLVK